MEIPFDRLPPGFAETVQSVPDEPIVPRPAATILLLRDSDSGVETLMLRRTRRSGFVPGAYVFAGGRVDAADGAAALEERTDGLDGASAASRLALDPGQEPKPIGYFLAAVREAFEETGILVGCTTDGAAQSAGESEETLRVRDQLLADEIDFVSALDALGARVDGEAIEYVAHWVTPVQEPRRYDTRFFAAKVERERQVSLSQQEMTDGIWLTPAAALDRHAQGTLPMVFPTIRTLEDLLDFDTADAVLQHYAAQSIPEILPRLVVTPTGVGLEVD